MASQESTITYDSIRIRSIRDLGDGIVTSKSDRLYTTNIQNKHIPIGTLQGIRSAEIVSTDTILASVKDNVSFTLNPFREESLDVIQGPVADSSYPYRTFVVQGIGSNITTLFITPWTSYHIRAESISDIGNSFVRIVSEWMVRYTDEITIKPICSSRHFIGDPISAEIILSSDIDSNSVSYLKLSSTVLSYWISKISIMRTYTLNIE